MIKIILLDGGGGVANLLLLEANSLPLVYKQLQSFYELTGDQNYVNATDRGRGYISEASAESALKKLVTHMQNAGYRNMTKNYEGEASTLTMILSDLDISPHMDLGDDIGETTLQMPRQMFGAQEPIETAPSPELSLPPETTTLPTLRDLEQSVPTIEETSPETMIIPEQGSV